MADYSQGDVIREYFSVLDTSGLPITGVNFTVEETLDPDGADFTVAVSEVGSGTYKATFLAEKVGTYYWRISTDVIVPEQVFEGTFVVGPFSIYGAAVGTAAYGVTLGRLVRMVAAQLGDYLQVIATTNGPADGSAMTDELRLSAISPNVLKGAALTIVAPSTSPNYMLSRMVAASSEGSTQLTFASPFPSQIVAGTEGVLTNLHSKGFHVSQYVQNINDAILEAYPFHLIPVAYTYPDTFNALDPTIPLPQYMTHIYAVDFYGPNGDILRMPMSPNNDSWRPGWWVDGPSATINVESIYYRSYVDGWTVRLLGYGRPAELSDWDDFTTVDAEWIRQRAAGALKWAKGDQQGYPIAANLENRAETSVLKIATPMQPGTIRVR